MPSLNLKLKIKNLKFTPGFTLIELLVVIAILGVLASFTSFALIGHARQARDAQRKSDLQTLKKALASARADCANAAYWPGTANGADEYASYNNMMLYLPNTATKYLPQLIYDPKNTGAYRYGTSGSTPTVVGTTAKCFSPSAGTSTYPGKTNWVIRAKMESSNDPDAAKSYTSCATELSNVDNTIWAFAPTSTDNYFYVCSY